MSDRISDYIKIPKGLTAIVGAGGKTSLLMRLGMELGVENKVILCTSTHIFSTVEVPFLINPCEAEIGEALRSDNVIAVGKTVIEGLKYGKIDVDFETLTRLADYVICEADGAKCLPLKAPADYEPQIPDCALLVIGVAGLDAVGKAIKDTVHRVDYFSKLVGKTPEDTVDAADIALVLQSTQGQKKNVFCDYLAIVNKADTEVELAIALEIAEDFDEKLLITALQTDKIIRGTGGKLRC